MPVCDPVLRRKLMLQRGCKSSSATLNSCGASVGSSRSEALRTIISE
jgi:hypothetical protein